MEDLAKGKSITHCKNRQDKPVKEVVYMDSDSNKTKSYEVIIYEDGTRQCSCMDHILRHRDCKHIIRAGVPPMEMKINDYITVKLTHGSLYRDGNGIERQSANNTSQTEIYVNGQLFTQCKYLLLNLSPQDFDKYDKINSIDEAFSVYNKNTNNRALEGGGYSNEFRISAYTEFWGHCSNLQAFADYGYDSRILHSNLAFPLLKKLYEVGDPQAKRVFKEEIAKSVEDAVNSGFVNVIESLINRKLFNLNLFSRDELKGLVLQMKKIPDYANGHWFKKSVDNIEIY